MLLPFAVGLVKSARARPMLAGLTGEGLSDEARIGSLIERQANGCWLFRGATDRYGRTWLPGQRRQVIVDRFLYEALVGPIPSGYRLHEECETDGCCNPEHRTPVHPGGVQPLV